MKLLFYINAINGGGAERVMVNLAGNFADEGYEVVLATSFKDEKWEYPLSGKVKRISFENGIVKQSRIKRNISRIVKLTKVCWKEKPDAAISFMNEPNLRLLLAPIKAKKIISVRNSPEKLFVSRSSKIIARYLYRFADGVVFQTQEAKSWFPDSIQRKSKVIYNVVDQKFFLEASTNKPVRNTVVAVGRLEKQKNYTGLIRAFTHVVKEIKEARLLIYGTGSMRDELENEIRQYGMETSIILMGQTADVVSALRSGEVFVLSSTYEGLPNALMEAMAMGMPCIAADCLGGGPRELFGEENKEYLVKNGDEADLAEKIIRLLGSEEEKKKNAARCKANAESFRADMIFRQWEGYLGEIV